VLQIQGQTRWIGHSVTLRSTPEDPTPTLHTQEVRSSRLRAPTIVYRGLVAHGPKKKSQRKPSESQFKGNPVVRRDS